MTTHKASSPVLSTPVNGLPGLEEIPNVNLKGFTNHALELPGKDEQAQKPPPTTSAPELPINQVGPFSFTFITWLSPLIWRMYKRRDESVEQDSIWTCSDEEGVELNTNRLKALWNAEVGTYGADKASFYRVWTKFILRRTLTEMAMLSVWVVSTFLSSAFLLKLILAYIEDEDDDMLYGLGLVVAILVTQLTRASSTSAAFAFGYQTGTRFRSGVTGLLYDKVLSLKSLNRSSSEILNIVSVDTQRVFIITWMVALILVLPLFTMIGVVYCYALIGYWAVVTIATFAVVFLFQVGLAKIMEKLRKRCVRFTDARIKYMGEILNSMKFIKLYAWEEPFKSAVEGERQQEKKFLLRSGIVQGIVTSIIPLTPTIASVVTISAYTAFGNDLSTSTAFALIGTANFMRYITFIIALSSRVYGEAVVSLNRVKEILLMEEYVPPSSNCLRSANAIELNHASFSWDFDQTHTTRNQTKNNTNHSDRLPSAEVILEEIALDVKKEQLIGICGAVGVGKSSLLSAILGRMQQLEGHLAVNGKVAYAAQQAWIFNGTVRDNILFGLEFNEKRYKDVIKCCGLEPDIQSLDFGDKTEIGEHGITLSGGQKQRVNLARAAYSNSDIYLLDDPMSALDTTVGKHVFQDCIKGFLKNKTVILVTHQLQYMSQCDEVIVLGKGKIVESGDHTALLQRRGVYTTMYNTFVNTATTTNHDKEQKFISKDKDTDVSCGLPDANGNSKHINNDTEQGKLVQEEEKAIGTVTFQTYKAFIQAAGGWLVVSLVVALYFLAAGSLVFSEWWLSAWLQSGYLSGTEDAYLRDGISVNETHPLHNTSNYTSTEAWSADLHHSGGVLSTLDADSFFFGYVVSFIGVICLQVMTGSAGAKIAIHASSQLHTNCLNSIVKAPLSFFESNPAGRILNRFTKDLDEGDVAIPEHTNICLQILCLIILTLGVSSYITPWILIAIVPVAVFVYLMKQVFAVSMRNLKRLENVSRSPLISHVDLTLQGLPSIISYGQQKAFFQKCVNYGSNASMMTLLFELNAFWISLRIDITAGCLNVVAFLIFVLSKGTIPPQSAGLVLSLLGKTVNQMDFLVTYLNQLESKFTSIERINHYSKFLDQEPQQGLTPSPPAWPTHGAIEFRNVVMRYRPHLDPVLKSVSFVIGPRQKVGVVGRTGAGKSSLAVCLFRLVEPSNGTILVDGQDVSQLSLSCLRSRISSIPQDPVLFNGTIRYNIDPFTVYTDDDVWTALERVKMKQTILQSDEKLDMLVEDNGSNFSVGERQLICLARAVLRDNKILLLDEATANIDTSTDAMIQETIRTCFVDCTVITIAHRLSTVLHSDKIIVLDAGQVVESASPDSLLADDSSHLNRMLAAQTLEN